MAKTAPYLYIDTNITNAYECKGNYMPYNSQTNKYRSSSPFLYNQRTSRNLQQMTIHNSQNLKHNNLHKTDSNSRFAPETKYNNRMPSPLLRSNPRITKINKEPEVIDINEILGKETKLPLTLSILTSHFENFELSRCSNNDNMGVIQAYSANTHQGIVRYIILYITRIGHIMKIEYLLLSILTNQTIGAKNLGLRYPSLVFMMGMAGRPVRSISETICINSYEK